MDDARQMRQRPRYRWVRYCKVSVLLILTGCAAWFGEDRQPPCPRAVTLADVQIMTVHQPGPGKDLTDVLVNGGITKAVSFCKYDDEGRIDASVFIDFNLSIGPAAKDSTGQWQYFVAVTDPDDNVVDKRVFTIDLKFEQAVFRTQIQEETRVNFAYAPWANAADYRIFVGFQLTRDQLEYLRSLKR